MTTTAHPIILAGEARPGRYHTVKGRHVIEIVRRASSRWPPEIRGHIPYRMQSSLVHNLTVRGWFPPDYALRPAPLAGGRP